MIKKGFTLAEVLITLGIIGVVAALTTPALVNNQGIAKIGPTLAKFVNTMETGIGTTMVEQSMSNFTGSPVDMAFLSHHVIMVPFEGDYIFTDATGENSKTISADTFNNLKNDCNACYLETKEDGCDSCDLNGDNKVTMNDVAKLASAASSTSAWQLKDGSIMILVPYDGNQDGRGTYQGLAAEVIYDIDGNGSVNRAGKDVFAFFLDKSGILVPAGSNAHKFLNYSGNFYVKQYQGTCDQSADFNKNFACTGKLADNKWNAKGIL